MEDGADRRKGGGGADPEGAGPSSVATRGGDAAAGFGHKAGAVSAGDSGDGRDGHAPTGDGNPPEPVVASRQQAGSAGEEGRPKRRRRRRRGRGRKRAADAAAAPPAEAGASQAGIPEKQTQSQPSKPAPRHKARAGGLPNHGRWRHTYSALDLGTNNCRLLVARPAKGGGFKVVDAFSRIVRLGEGLGQAGALSEDAMDRALDALSICAAKMRKRGVTRARSIATQACRGAANGSEFVERVRVETGIELEVVTTEEEAQLAVAGCSPLLDRQSDWALVFDIGGGSTELMLLSLDRQNGHRIEAWTSIACGVVTLAEKHGGVHVDQAIFRAMVDEVRGQLEGFEREHGLRGRFGDGDAHFLGTSGTVTTIAGVHLGLKRYNRTRVDGCWLSMSDVYDVTRGLEAMSFDDRAAHPCIGQERADLVLAGCAILEAMHELWPCERLRVADRGLREGILMSLMQQADGERPRGRRRRGRGRRSGSAPKAAT